MSLVDKTEELGAAYEAGQISHADAVHQLQQYSDGGITQVGAATLLAKWRTARAQVADTRRATEQGLAYAQDRLRRLTEEN